MDDQLSIFLSYLKQERQYSDNTMVAYRNDLSQFRNFLQRYPDVEAWSDVTAPIVQNYVKAMQEEAAYDYAPSSIARKVAALKSFFHFLFARQFIDADPTKDLESPKVKKKLPKTLTTDDVERLLAATHKEQTPKHLRDAALLALLYATGMRVTEVVSLKQSDINLDTATIICPGQDGQNRELPFNENTAAILRAYLSEGRPQLARNPEETALFLNHRGQQLTRQGLWLIIKAYAKEANLSSQVTPHTLRHSFAAHKLTYGSDLKEVQKLLGHANISTTQIYTQISKDE